MRLQPQGRKGKNNATSTVWHVEGVGGMRIQVLLCTVLAWGFWFVSGHPAAAQSPSFDCSRARLPDEIAICRTPELAEFDNVIAAAYAYLKSTRGRVYADQVGIPFWRLRQACQYDSGCIRQVQGLSGCRRTHRDAAAFDNRGVRSDELSE